MFYLTKCKKSVYGDCSRYIRDRSVLNERVAVIDPRKYYAAPEIELRGFSVISTVFVKLHEKPIFRHLFFFVGAIEGIGFAGP